MYSYPNLSFGTLCTPGTDCSSGRHLVAGTAASRLGPPRPMTDVFQMITVCIHSAAAYYTVLLTYLLFFCFGWNLSPKNFTTNDG